MTSPQPSLLVNYPKGYTNGIKISQINKAINLPAVAVPEGADLVLRSRYTNSGIIYMAFDPQWVLDITKAEYLLPNEAFRWHLNNANLLWIAGTGINDIILFSCEQGLGGS